MQPLKCEPLPSHCSDDVLSDVVPSADPCGASEGGLRRFRHHQSAISRTTSCSTGLRIVSITKPMASCDMDLPNGVHPSVVKETATATRGSDTASKYGAFNSTRQQVKLDPTMNESVL